MTTTPSMYNRTQKDISVSIPRTPGVVSFNVYVSKDQTSFVLVGNAPNMDNRFAFDNGQQRHWIGGNKPLHIIKNNQLTGAIPGFDINLDPVWIAVTEVSISGVETPLGSALPSPLSPSILSEPPRQFQEFTEEPSTRVYKEFNAVLPAASLFPTTVLDVRPFLGGLTARVVKITATGGNLDIKFNSPFNDRVMVMNGEVERAWRLDEIANVAKIYLQNSGGTPITYRIWVSA